MSFGKLFHKSTTRLAYSQQSTRKSSGDEIPNVNFFTTTSSTIFTQCAREATEFGEITQNKGNDMGMTVLDQFGLKSQQGASQSRRD